jgi:hypothetical protein
MGTDSAIWTVRGRTYKLTVSNSQQYIVLDGVNEPHVQKLSFDQWKLLESTIEKSRQNGAAEVIDFQELVRNNGLLSLSMQH